MTTLIAVMIAFNVVVVLVVAAAIVHNERRARAADRRAAEAVEAFLRLGFGALDAAPAREIDVEELLATQEHRFGGGT